MGIDPQPHLTDASESLLTADDAGTRRSFLKKVAIGGAAAAVGSQMLPGRAFAQDAEGDTSTTTEAAPPAEEDAVPLTDDEQLVVFLAGISHAAAAAFRAAVGDEPEPEAPAEGPAVPLAEISVVALTEPVVEVLQGFGAEHSGQAEAFGALLAEPITEPNGTLLLEVRSQLDSATDEAGVLAVLLDLDERIAATHLDAIGTFVDVNDTKVAAATLPVLGQQVVVLGQLAEPPTALATLIPEEQTIDGALDDEAYPVDQALAPPAQTTTTTAPADAPAGGDGVEPDSTTEPAPADGTETNGGATDTESEG